MKVDARKSADLIDRRRIAAATFLAGVLALIATWLGRAPARDPEAHLVHVVSTALDRGQSYWSERVHGYRRAKVVLYRKATSTPCGRGVAASGPFYCPIDERVYLDLSFLSKIENDLARAYVIAHELGHHVQKLRGNLDGRPSIEVELGADCLAGRWIAAEHLAGRLEVGDVAAAIAETSSIGDDKLCPACSPEQWSHGSSEQRVSAVTAGIAGRPCPLQPPAAPAKDLP